MAAVDPQLVMDLHRRTGVPLMRCKAALVEAAGDVDAAVEVLRRPNPCRDAFPPAGFWEQFRRDPPSTASDAESDAT